jgi:ABC-type nitrate/sulfonate/bicarbonate transport system permease component
VSDKLAARRRPRALRALRAGGRALPVLALLAAWQAVAQSGLVDPAFLPSVGSILAAVADLLRGGEVSGNLAITLFRALAGLALAVGGGVAIGVAMAMSRAADGFFGPLVSLTYSLPKSALVPLLLLWFGIGTATDVTAVFLACLLPIVIHTYQGVKGVQPVLVWSARAMGTPSGRLLWRVMIPAALPLILTGIRIALGFSFVLAVSAEMIASTDGIGKLIFMYGENGSYSYMFAAIGVVVAVAYGADRAFLALMRLLLRWHEFAQHAAEGAA